LKLWNVEGLLLGRDTVPAQAETFGSESTICLSIFSFQTFLTLILNLAVVLDPTTCESDPSRAVF
jgi:hypothetical protein